MKLKLSLLLALTCMSLVWGNANNVRIADKVKVAGRLGKDTIMLSFPLKWDNSWRLDENWDAVYLFIKYKRMNVEEPWRHLCLKDEGHRVDAGYTWALAKTGRDNVGMFVFRSNTGAGASSTMVRVVIDITKGDLQPFYPATYEDFKSGNIDISVSAIEMVFVPRGPYYLGDGFSYDSFATDAGTACLVSSNDALALRVRNGNNTDIKKDVLTVGKLYPKGYDGFYCMKYEISQEQYVDFLNKLPYSQQKKRIGNNLDELVVGDYVFGEKDFANGRNGIILQKRKTKGWGALASHSGDTAVIFGFNGDRDDAGYNSPTDGKTVACNFLTPEDAKAYADWTGLRLMTEMEYEKSCRIRNPQAPPSGYQYAWNGLTMKIPTGIATGTKGTVYEIPTGDANVNVGNANGGPLRCGSFAQAGTTSMSATGATFWGIFDMTGNLAEMCCNAAAGKEMLDEPGDGSLLSEVISWSKDTVVNWYGSVHVPPYTTKVKVIRALGTRFKDRWGRTVYIRDTFEVATPFLKVSNSVSYSVGRPLLAPVPAWPKVLAAYGTRGGSYASTSRDETAVSGRAKFDFFKTNELMDPALIKAVRSPEVTFRLVRNAPEMKIKAGRIGLQNDTFEDTVVLCKEVPYIIQELDGGTPVASTILYEWEENSGDGWKTIQNADQKDLSLTVHWNMDEFMVSRKYRRKSVTPMGEGYSNEVTLTLVGQPKVSPLQAVIGDCNRIVPTVGSVEVMADSIVWFRNDTHAAIGTKVLNAKESLYSPTRTEFPNPGNYQVLFQAYVDGCPLEALANVSVEPATGVADCPSVVKDINQDGTEIVYHGVVMADCRCWLVEPAKKQTANSIDGPGGDGVQMYNFEDLQYELTQINDVDPNFESAICPKGFYVASDVQAEQLAFAMQGTVVPDNFKGNNYGYYNNVENIPGYYWALIYHDSAENENNYWWKVMYIDENGFMDVGTELFNSVDDLTEEPWYDYFYTVRCIKGKPLN